MSELLSLCDDQTSLNFIEEGLLQRLPEGSHELVPNPQCELQAGHSRVHAALAQESQGRFWWLVWAPDGRQLRFQGQETDRRIYPIGNCGRQSPEDEDEFCLLMQNHPGAHSYEMESSGPRTPARWVRRNFAALLREAMAPEELAFYKEVEESLDAPGGVLPLITQGEAIALGMMLLRNAPDDPVLEDLVDKLLDRMDQRHSELVGAE